VSGTELNGRRILVVEDEWFLADEISHAVNRAAGTVVGPVASVEEALELLQREPEPDAATLNVRVADGESYPVADELARRHIPFLFASANSASSLPGRFSRRAIVGKPFSGARLVTALSALLG
jgi:CheY-like chemotaxis protein